MHRPEGRMARSQARRVMAAWCMVCRSMGALRLGGRAGWGFLMREGPEEALQQARPQCWGLWWPALTSVLPEGSCTELPRGRLLGPARGSSVQDASGWESAGSRQEARRRGGPSTALTRFLVVSAPTLTPHNLGPGSGPRRKQAPGFLHSAKSRVASPMPPKVLALGFPTYLDTWRKKKKDCGSSYRIKLDLTPQQLKEVTVLTPALPRVSLGCFFSRLAGVSPGNNPKVQII